MPFLLGLLTAGIRFVFGAATIRFVTFTALVAVVGGLVTLAVGFVPHWLTRQNVVDFAQGIPAQAWYFLDYFKFQVGLGGIFGAYVARFLLRRIPFIN